MSPDAPVAVVGAGAAGLMAAHALRTAGREVVVLEASPRVGGAIRTIARDGWLLEGGPNTVAAVPPPVEAVLDAAGILAERIVPDAAAARRFLVHDGRPVAVPSSPAEMVSTPLLSVAGRLRLLKEPFVPRGGHELETVAEFAARRLGPEAAARFIDPVVSGTSGGDPAALLARFAFPQLVEFERTAGSILKGRMRAARTARREGRRPGSLWSCRDGLGRVPELLAAALGDRVRLGAPVVSVRAGAGGGFTVGTAAGDTLEASGVILAVPAAAFAHLDLDLPGAPDLSPIARMPHASLSVVSLGFARDAVAHPLDGFGVLAPSAAGRRILGTLFPSSIFPGRAPAGHVLLTSFVGGVGRAALADLPDTELQALVTAELAELLGVRGAPVLAEITRWPAALPQAVAGHAERLAVAGAVEAAVPGVVFCGSWRDGLAVGEVMRGGLSAAARLPAATR